MPSEVKQRKKKQSDEASPANCKDEELKGNKTDKTSSLDLKGFMCFVSLAACGALSFLVAQQNERFSKIEEKFTLLHGKTVSLFEMEEEVLQVSKKCESVQQMLEGLGGQRGALQAQLGSLEQEVGRLREWSSGLTETRAQLHGSLSALTAAVDQIQERTSAITKDFTNKVASVKTDVRRMDGLRSELESLLVQVGELEEQTSQVERSMVKRIGDVLTGSIDRVSNLRAASERNWQALEQLRRRLPELAAADKLISERLVELEGGRARLIRAVTFAGDLKPKVAGIKRDFAAFEPLVSDLTLRIGRLAEDLGQRQREISELRRTLANLTAAGGELGDASEQVGEVADLLGGQAADASV